MLSKRKGGTLSIAPVRKKVKKTLKTLAGVLETYHLVILPLELTRNVRASVAANEVRSKMILKALHLTEMVPELQLNSIQTSRKPLTRS